MAFSTKKSFCALAVALALSVPNSVLVAHAVTIGKGIIHTASCGSAQAEFISAPELHGFFHTRNAVEIVNAGSGTAGIRINFVYPNGDDFESRDAFINFQFDAKHDAGAGENTVVEFCFRGDNRKIFSISRPLSDFSGGGQPDFLDWRRRDFNWTQITEFDARKAKLISVSFSLASRGNLTIGWNDLQLNSLRDIGAGEMDLTPYNCSILTGCGEFKLQRLERRGRLRRLR